MPFEHTTSHTTTKMDNNEIDPLLMPGDRVVVGTDGLSRAWQDALQAIPVFALFTRI